MHTIALQSDSGTRRFEAMALGILRYGLCFVVGWVALMKFTRYEAVGIQPLIARSPLMSWTFHFWSVRTVSSLIGATELLIVILILLRKWSPRACMIGSALGCVMFLTTLSFILTTPGWEPTLGGFPALSLGVGEFIIKDVVLFAASLWSFAEAKHADAILTSRRAS